MRAPLLGPRAAPSLTLRRCMRQLLLRIQNWLARGLPRRPTRYAWRLFRRAPLLSSGSAPGQGYRPGGWLGTESPTDEAYRNNLHSIQEKKNV